MKTPPAGLFHIDVARGVRAIGASNRRVFVVAWNGEAPLGSFPVEPGELPMPASAVAERIAVACAPAIGDAVLDAGFEAAAADIPLDPPGVPNLALLDAPLRQFGTHDRATPAPGSLGVIVCTRDRPEALSRCLAALLASSTPADDILVVDNAPTSSATRDVVAANPGVRYLLEPTPGLSRARNAGLRDCRADIVAFTDDDVLVHPAWTTRIVSAFANPDVAAVTGLVLPASLDSEAEWMFETAFGGFSQGYRPFDTNRRFLEATRAIGAPVWRLGAGANMAFRRADIIAVGAFDERLGAGAAGCSEDSEAWYRLLARGRTIRYDPRAVVFHAHRGDVDALRRQMFLYMRGHVAALFVQFERTGEWGNLRRLAITLPRYYVGRVMRARSGADTVFAEIRGAVAGIGYYLVHRGDPRSARVQGSAAPG